MNESEMKHVIACSKKTLKDLRNDLVIADCQRNEHADPNVILAIIAINKLETLLNKILYKYSDNFSESKRLDLQDI